MIESPGRETVLPQSEKFEKKIVYSSKVLDLQNTQ